MHAIKNNPFLYHCNNYRISHKYLDIVLPLYNPSSSWAEEIVNHFFDLKDRFDQTWSISLSIVDDGNDLDLSEGLKLIRSSIPDVNWISYPLNQGKGHALREGIKHGEGSIIVYTDFDFPYQVKNIYEMVERLDNGDADVLVGVRDESYYRHISFMRRIISKILKLLNSIFLKIPTVDTQCGLKAFNTKGKLIFERTSTKRYLVDVEFLKLLAKTDLKVKTHLVEVREDLVLSEIKNLKLLREMFSYIRILFS
ncbi:MAG: glycosyltransferase family 2 protein [Saprospiraceae bacterium]|nr:glycosyltransferase family 2 protein [Saprospiraceae bacterium]